MDNIKQSLSQFSKDSLRSSNTESLVLDQETDLSTIYSTGHTTLTYLLNKRLLRVSGGVELHSQNMDVLINEYFRTYGLDSGFIHRQHNAFIDLVWREKISKYSSITANAAYGFYKSNLSQTSNLEVYSKWSLDFQVIKTDREIKASYTKNVEVPGFFDIVNLPYRSNYRTIQQGSGFPALLDKHIFSFYYSRNNLNKLSNALDYHVQLSSAISNEYYLNRYFLKAELTEVNRAINPSPAYELSLNTGIGMYVSSVATKIMLKPSASFISYELATNNDVLYPATFYNYGYEFKARTGFLTMLNFDLGFTHYLNLAKTTNSMRINKNQSRSQSVYLDFLFNPSKRLNIKWQNEYYSYSINSRSAQRSVFSNLFVGYRMPKANLILGLEVNNILNTSKYINIDNSDHFSLIRQVRLIPRYGLLRIDYSF